MKKSKKTPTLIVVSTYPPKECGIANFSHDLRSAFRNVFGENLGLEIAAVSAETEKFTYGPEVGIKIEKYSPSSFAAAASAINSRPEIFAVNIQHEYGIFGGEYGSLILDFIKKLKKPSIVTLHTVLPDPDPKMFIVTHKLVRLASELVVMTKRSKVLLVSRYGAEPSRVKVIPHGIHQIPFIFSEEAKKDLGLKKKTVVSTFGLLSPNKGVEYVLKALPSVIRRIPNLLYLVIGTTHPEIVKQHGESYRFFLEDTVKNLKIKKHVKFINKYLSLGSLLKYLQATDVYAATSLDPDQAVSGTFSYALGSGRPVVSTRFAQASSELAPETGKLVDFKKPEAFSKALAELFSEPEKLKAMGQEAYQRSRHMVWENVALSYLKVFGQNNLKLLETPLVFPPLNFSHLFKITDQRGIYQFSRLSDPDPQFGYTLDDNARALQAAARGFAVTKEQKLLKACLIYLKFIDAAVIAESKQLVNYFTASFSTREEKNFTENLEDSNARAWQALLEIKNSSGLPKKITQAASKILSRLPSLKQAEFSHLRARAFFILGLCREYEKTRNLEALGQIQRHADVLTEALKNNSEGKWKWFERKITYSNAVLSHALLAAAKVSDSAVYARAGLESLEFLISKTFLRGIYVPIGQDGWHELGKKRAFFDQQPEDASATVQALLAANRLTGQERYLNLSRRAFEWYLGRNMLGQLVYDRSTGGCYDGITRTSVNLNQGAESLVSYLLARIAMELGSKK